MMVDRSGLPYHTFFVHLSTDRTVASTKVECFGTQEKFLDEFLRERVTISAKCTETKVRAS